MINKLKDNENNSWYLLIFLFNNLVTKVTLICSPLLNVYESPKKVRAAKLNPAVSVESIVIFTNLPKIWAIIVKAIIDKKKAER